jgi:uncharacterized repeat protein (TIGR01451 family)
MQNGFLFFSYNGREQMLKNSKQKDEKMALFYNRATLSYNGQNLNSNQVSGEIIEALTMTKTAITGTYGVGDSISYAISIVNSGATAINGLTLTDDLGEYIFQDLTLRPLTYRDGSVLFYIDGALQPAPTVTAVDDLVISGLNIPAGSNAIIIYETLANGFAPLVAGSTITNTATVTGCGIAEALTDTATVGVQDEPNLSIAKAICPAVVSDNGQLTYTFIIQNTGNTPIVATDNVIVTDVFNPALSGITVTFNGENWTAGTNYTYNEATGEFATLANAITVDAATYTRDATTGLITINPGVSVLTVSGTI